MIAEGKNPWEAFVEGQLIDWAIEWTKFHPDPVFLSQPKQADVLRKALRIRRVAEQAAAASWQTGPWSDALLESCDAARRQAQDDLFTGTQDPESAMRQFKEIESSYNRVVRYGAALELVEEIRTEWPFLGAWKARRAALSGQGEIQRTTDFIVNFARHVAKLQARLDPWAPRENPTEPRIADFEREYDAVRQDFDVVKSEFNSAVEACNPSSSWRELDLLLAVPSIRSEVRERLVATVVAHSLDDALVPRAKASPAAGAGTDDSPKDTKAEPKPSDDRAAAKEADGKPEAKPVDGKPEVKPPAPAVEPADHSRGGSLATDESPDDDASQPDVVADPAFWAEASGMAMVEWSLLVIGEVDGMLAAAPRTRQGSGLLDQLQTEISSASQIEWKSDSKKAFEHHRDRISAKLRNLRSWLADACIKRGDGLADPDELWDENHRSRVSLERTLAALPRPLVDLALSRVRNPRFPKLAADLAGIHVRAILLRNARRLLEDLDTTRAAAYLKMAGNTASADSAAAKLRQRLEALQAAKIKVGGAKVVLDGDSFQQKMEVSVEPDRPIPKGRGVVFFGPDPKKDLEILRDDPQSGTMDVTRGTPVAVSADGPVVKAAYILRRGIDVDDREGGAVNRDHAEKTLAPALYYRGHTYQTTEPISVVLEPLKDVVYVAVRQDRQTIPKGYRDQFRLHPSDGYMHYGEDLKFEVVLTNWTTTPQDLLVDYKLEQDPESERHEVVKLKPKESKAIFNELVRGVDLKKIGARRSKAARSTSAGQGTS